MAMRFAELLNEEARELEAIGCDVIQFDEPAFNVYMDEVRDWGVAALERAAAGPQMHHRRPYLLRLRHQGEYRLEIRPRERMEPIRANLPGPGQKQDRPGLARMHQFAGAGRLLGLLKGKDVLLGAIDVANDKAETPEQVAATIKPALPFVAPEQLFPCTNCGMAPMRRHRDLEAARPCRRRGAGAQSPRLEHDSKGLNQKDIPTHSGL